MPASRLRLPRSAHARAAPARPETAEHTAEHTAATAAGRTRLTSALATIVAAPANRLALALLGVATLYRLVLILRGWPALDSDEAIIGLMARHILHGQFDYWFWGQQYMGAFQAYVVAGVFAVLGSSTFTLHLTMLLFTIGFLAAMYALGRAAYGSAVGLLTLGWLAIGPPVSVLRELTAIGGYQDILLFGALVLFGVWSRLRQPARLPQTGREWRRALLVYAGIGLAGGIGFWSDLLIVPVLVLAACALLAVRTREVFSACGVVLVLAFFCGGFPYISYNITNKNATYKEIVRQTHPGGGSQATLPAPGDWLNQIGETFAVAVPTVLASPRVCVNEGTIWPAYPPAEATANAGTPGACDDANIAFSLAVVFLYLTVAWQLVVAARSWLVAWLARLLPDNASAGGHDAAEGRQLYATPEGPVPGRQSRPRNLPARAGRRLTSAIHTTRVASGPRSALRTVRRRLSAAPLSPPTFALTSDETARLWLRLMLLGVAAMTLALYTTNQDAQRYQFTSTRYLLPLYLTTPLLFGSLWHVAAPRLRPVFAVLLRRVSAGSATALVPEVRGTEVPAHAAERGLKSAETGTACDRGKAPGRRDSNSPSRRRVPTRAGVRGTPGEAGGPRWDHGKGLGVRDPILASLALLLLLALSIGGGFLTLAYAFDGQRFALPEPPLDHDLIAFLDAHHITAYYSDYWTCYRVMFETNERITCAVRGQNGEVGLELINNRSDAYVRAVAADPAPAYILPAGTMQDQYFTLEVTAEHLPHDGYRRAVLDGYAIYYRP